MWNRIYTNELYFGDFSVFILLSFNSPGRSAPTNLNVIMAKVKGIKYNVEPLQPTASTNTTRNPIYSSRLSHAQLLLAHGMPTKACELIFASCEGGCILRFRFMFDMTYIHVRAPAVRLCGCRNSGNMQRLER